MDHSEPKYGSTMYGLSSRVIAAIAGDFCLISRSSESVMERVIAASTPPSASRSLETVPAYPLITATPEAPIDRGITPWMAHLQVGSQTFHSLLRQKR